MSAGAAGDRAKAMVEDNNNVATIKIWRITPSYIKELACTHVGWPASSTETTFWPSQGDNTGSVWGAVSGNWFAADVELVCTNPWNAIATKKVAKRRN